MALLALLESICVK